MESAVSGKKGKIVIEGLGNYFVELLHDQERVKAFIYSILRREVVSKFENVEFNHVIGVHIRLGDYSSERRTPIDWYETIIKEILSSIGDKYKFFVFSDGQDYELTEILSIPQVEKVFFGNAISDILALSKCELIIGSDSTFSAWASFIEQVPVIFPKRHFGTVLNDSKKEFIFDGDYKSLRLFIKNIF